MLIDVGSALACACCVCSWGAKCTDLPGSLALALGHIHTLDVVYVRGGQSALTFQGFWHLLWATFICRIECMSWGVSALTLSDGLDVGDKHGVATYPFAAERGEAHGCVFQRRKMGGVATNVYLWKTSEKSKETSHEEYSRFGSCIYI